MLSRTLPAATIAAERAARRQRLANAEMHDEATRSIEAYAEWLAEVWDHGLDECDDATLERAEAVKHALETALKPWAAEIIAYHRRDRAAAKFPPSRSLRLFSATLPAGEAAR